MGPDLFIEEQIDWHAMSSKEAMARLQTSPDGLGNEEAEIRLISDGPNRLPSAPPPSWRLRLARQLNNVLMKVLLAAAIISLLLGHAIDALVIVAVVIVNTAIGFFQEGRAERALEAIKAMIDPQATVLRNGRRITLPATGVVRGDVMLIEAGDRVTADLRLLQARNLKVEEAALTGESVPVVKKPDVAAVASPLGDRHGMAYSGTLVASGQGAGVVVATGATTELGRISQMVRAVGTLETPLVQQMARFARQLTSVVLAVAAIAFLIAWGVRDYLVSEAFMLLVGLFVAAIPEGLPAILSITLAIGVQRMAARNAIIRRLPAVETLGSVSIICSDKTGTLTRNEMTVVSVVTPEGETAIPGAGYAPEPSAPLEGLATDLVRAGVLCNDAELRRDGDDWLPVGDPMEGALVVVAIKAGLDPTGSRRAAERLDAIPFDAQHRYMATLHRENGRADTIYVKGAPEEVLQMCSQQRMAEGDLPLERDHWLREAGRLARQGQRVLAFAAKISASGVLDQADIRDDAVFLGLVGMIDPPREEAQEAVAACRTAGIRVAMITGDHAVTAAEIARQLGIAENPKVLTGIELDQLDSEALQQAVRETPVFARASPENKLRLVEALQAQGFKVAMTGDGVNDAPALKRADIGIAMGRKGTEASKEAAEMVLADDNFASIVRAVEEGRTVYDNLRKAIAFLLPVNGGESLSLLLAVLVGVALPIEPVQILWVNMVSSVALATVLAFEPTEPGTMRRPPRGAGEALLSRFVIWRVALVSSLFMAGIFGMFEYVLRSGGSVELARTAAVNTLVVMEIFYLFSVRYLRAPSFTFTGVKGTPRVLAAIAVVVLLQLAFTYLPLLQAAFRTEEVPLGLGLIIVMVGPVLLALLEIEKWVRRQREALQGRAAGLQQPAV